ncbi:MAG: acetyltransferase [Gammaproteobacteria bacterium]|nr:MAG: acetyltransferase [Gammaproteobacteria bacterium]
MFLKEQSSNHLVEVMSLQGLIDPFQAHISVRFHYGEEAQEPESIEKSTLVFPSGEPLPRCWLDPHYRDHELPAQS